MSKRRLRILMFLLTMFAIGSIVLAACARPGSPTASSGTPGSGGGGSTGEPTVHMGAVNFVQSTVSVPKGQKLMLVDDGQYLHILANGSWVNGTAVPKKETGAPTVDNVQVNGTNLEVGPFTTAGTFHIYCSVHTDMNLDITVK